MMMMMLMMTMMMMRSLWLCHVIYVYTAQPICQAT
jgi:hypothetical protein